MLDTVRRHLERISKRALLIVLDGLEDEESLVATHDPKLSLLSLLPKGNQARILATTRSKSLARRWSGTKSESVIPVSRLSVDDASVILFGTRIQGGRLSWSKTVGETLRFSAGEISMALQYKSLLKREFNSQAKAYLGMIGASSRPMTTDPGPRCPAPSWKPLHQRIEAESPRLMDLMEMICVMDVQCVPSILFNRAERSKGIPQLIRYGLIEPSADDRIFTITAMIRGCIRTSFSHPQGGKDAEVAAQESSLARVSDLFKTEPREFLPCALSVLHFKPISSSAKSHLVGLHQDVSEHMEGMKQYARAAMLLEASLQLLQKSIPNSEKKQAEVRSSLERLRSLAHEGADVLSQKKDVSIARRGVRVSDVSREYLYSEDDAHARRTYDTAVLQLLQATPSSDVIALSRELSSWSGKKYGDSSVRSAKHQFNLGLAYAARGQYPEAETEFRLTLKRMAAAAQQPPHGEVDNRRDAEQMQYRVHAELARLYCEQQRFKDAEVAFQESLPGQWRLLGHDHVDTLATRHTGDETHSCRVFARAGRFGRCAGGASCTASRPVRGAGSE
jgi:tetratricopeptide (TPR) repeat protein